MLINGYQIKQPYIKYGKINSDRFSNLIFDDNGIPFIKFWILKRPLLIGGISQFFAVLDCKVTRKDDTENFALTISIDEKNEVSLSFASKNYIKNALISKIFKKENEDQMIDIQDVQEEYLLKLIDKIINYLNNENVIKTYMFQFKKCFQTAKGYNVGAATELILKYNDSLKKSEINYIELVDCIIF